MHLSSWGEIEEGGRATSTSPVRDAFMLADQIALDPYAVDPTPYITEGPTPGDEEEYSQFNRPRRQTTISPSRYAEFGAPLVPQRLRRHGDPENKRCFALGNHPAKFDPADISDPEDPEYSDLDGSRTLVGLHQSYIIDPPPPRKASSSTVSLPKKKPRPACCVEPQQIITAVETAVGGLYDTCWDGFIALVALAAVLAFPFDAAFRPYSRDCNCFGLWLGYALDVVYGMDVLLQLFKAPYARHETEQPDSPKADGYTNLVARLTGGWFAADVLSLVPLEALFGRHMRVWQLLKANRLLRLHRVVTAACRLPSAHSPPRQLLQLTALLLAIAHVMACGWWAVGISQTDMHRWTAAAGLEPLQPLAPSHAQLTLERYTASLHWSVGMLCLAYDTGARTLDEQWFAMGCSMVAMLLYATVVALMVSALLPRRNNLLSIVNKLLYMDQAPRDLKRRVEASVDAARKLTADDHAHCAAEALATVPRTLRMEVLLHVHKDMVRASPLLKDASSALIQEVLLKLRPFSLVAGEWLYRAGDVGRDAVFVRTGTLQVVETSDTGTAVVTYTATAGSILGETSLFLTPSLRSSSVKAVTDAELHSLAKVDYDEIMVHFPAERAKMLLHVSEYNTPPRDESAAKPSVSSPILDDTGQVEEDHIIAHTLSMQLAYLDRQMLQDGVSMEEMEDLQFRREAMQSELNRVAAHSVPQPSTPTTIKTVSSDSEQSEHACFANIRKMLTQGANGPSSVGTHPLHTTPVASAVAGPSSGPLDTMTMDAHLMHVVEEMDSRTVFLLHLMKEIKTILCERLPELDAEFWNLATQEGSDAGGVDFVTACT